MSAEIYRQTKLGDSLVSALEVLVESDKITADLAIKVLSEVWTFIVSDAKFKTNFTSTASTTNAPEVTVDKVQIVCVDAKVFDAQS
ncbi:TPA: hypothetical protein ACH3X1_010113 [Trebouxia sp. C0004]